VNSKAFDVKVEHIRDLCIIPLLFVVVTVTFAWTGEISYVDD